VDVTTAVGHDQFSAVAWIQVPFGNGGSSYIAGCDTSRLDGKLKGGS
jgi:hypothetical protein